jgi:hypothetical protein
MGEFHPKTLLDPRFPIGYRVNISRNLLEETG